MNEDIQRTLGRMEGKLEAILTGQAAQLKTIEKHDERLDGLEKWQGKIVGAIALATFVLGIVAKVVF